MPDLATRRQHEEALAAVLLIHWDGWRGSMPISPLRFSWVAAERNLANDPRLIGELQATFLEAANQIAEEKGPSAARVDLTRQAMAYAGRVGAAVAAAIVATTRQRLMEARGMDEAAAMALVDAALGESRAESIAVTEITRAISNAEHAALATLAAVFAVTQPEPHWFTEGDGRVCVECLPLHGTGREVWGMLFPTGPPAHPRCRCWLTWL